MPVGVREPAVIASSAASLIIGCTVLCGAAWADPIIVDTHWAGGFDNLESAAARLVLVANADAADAHGASVATEVSLEIDVPGRVDIDPLVASGARLRIEGEGLWSPEVTVEGAKSGPVTLAVYPTGEIRFRSASDAHPDAVTAVFASSLRADLIRPEEPFESAEEACTLGKRDLTCSLPAGILDLRLEADGFAPIYRWETEVSRGGSHAGGVLRFVRGTSVAGWVHDADDRPLADVEIDVQPFLVAARHSDPEAIHRALRGSRSVTTSDRGFFQLTGLGVGSFQIRARHHDFAEFVAEEPVLLLEEGEALVIDPFRMPLPARFSASVMPPMGPSEEPWHFILMEAEPDPGEAPEELVGRGSNEGLWMQKGVEPGRYFFRVEDENGSTWYAEPIEVSAGSETIFVDIPVLEIEGSLEHGEEGLQGIVTFQAAPGYERLRFRADEDGEFAGYLPGEGWWHVDVEIAGEEDLALALDAIEIEAPVGGGPAKVTVEIPDTRVVGEVVDSEGNLVPNATVKVYRASSSGGPRAGRVRATEQRTDAEGAFEILGQPPGRLTLSARLDGRTSANVMVVLEEDGEPPSQRLVLRGQRDLEGQVVSAFGNVAGAQVVVWADILSTSFDGFGRTADVKMATTDSVGAFELTIPDDLAIIILMVRAPGFGVRLMRHPVEDGRPAMVHVDDQRGTLVLTADEVGALTLVIDAIPVSPVILRTLMGQRFGGEPTYLELPGMASGTYSACAQRADAIAVLQGQGGAGCKSGFLGSGSVLKLSLDSGSASTSDNFDDHGGR